MIRKLKTKGVANTAIEIKNYWKTKALGTKYQDERLIS